MSTAISGVLHSSRGKDAAAVCCCERVRCRGFANQSCADFPFPFAKSVRIFKNVSAPDAHGNFSSLLAVGYETPARHLQQPQGAGGGERGHGRRHVGSAGEGDFGAQEREAVAQGQPTQGAKRKTKPATQTKGLPNLNCCVFELDTQEPFDSFTHLPLPIPTCSI